LLKVPSPSIRFFSVEAPAHGCLKVARRVPSVARRGDRRANRGYALPLQHSTTGQSLILDIDVDDSLLCRYQSSSRRGARRLCKLCRILAGTAPCTTPRPLSPGGAA